MFLLTCRTHLYYHIAADTLYMISHHITDIMTGTTLQSTFSSYRNCRHAWTGTRKWRYRALRRTLTRQHVATAKKKKKKKEKKTKADRQRPQTRWQNHTADGLKSWLGWLKVAIGLMAVSVPVTLRKIKSSLPPVQECLGRGGTSQQIVAERCVDGARPEWGWVEWVTHARWDCERLDERRLRGGCLFEDDFSHSGQLAIDD